MGDFARSQRVWGWPGVMSDDHRALLLVERYPQLSETYISTEANGLGRAGLLAGIGAERPGKAPLDDPQPFTIVGDLDVDPAIAVRLSIDVGATVLHTHYLHMAPLVDAVARGAGLTFTVRTHSYDVLKAHPTVLRRLCDAINRSRCVGVLGFPFVCELLRHHGLREELLHESWPVIDYQRFFDRSPNGSGVLNVGAALEKKNFPGYIDFAATRADLRFSLYPIGYETADIVSYNVRKGGPVDIREAVQPAAMPAVYKAHQWLVYTTSPRLNTVGWPMAVAEAQASGVGVCLQSHRRADAELLGGAGFQFTDPSSVSDLISGPVPSDIRERGFAVAERSDVARHVVQLSRIWSANSV